MLLLVHIIIAVTSVVAIGIGLGYRYLGIQAKNSIIIAKLTSFATVLSGFLLLLDAKSITKTCAVLGAYTILSFVAIKRLEKPTTSSIAKLFVN